MKNEIKLYLDPAYLYSKTESKATNTEYEKINNPTSIHTTNKNNSMQKKIHFNPKVERFVYNTHSCTTPNSDTYTDQKQGKNKIKKKINNKNFYANLPLTHFNDEKYEKVVLKSTKFSEEPEENQTITELVKIAMDENTYHLDEIPSTTNHSFIRLFQPNELETEEERCEYLLNNIDLNHCSIEQKSAMHDIFKQYSMAFQIDGEKFQHTSASEHKINLIPGTTPTNIRQFRIPESHKAEIQKQLDDLETKGIISKCESPWNSPIFLVPKKENDRGEKQYRLVIDYRALNKTIEPSAYPIPLIDEIVDQMQNCTLFTTLDLYGAFHQIPLEKESRQYTAFSTAWEKYCFNSVPFGLVSSPYAWLKAIHSVLRGIIGRNLFVYMDDIIIFSHDLQQHIATLRAVLHRLQTYKLKLKIDKSKFLQGSVRYLGFIISSDGLKTDPKKNRGNTEIPYATQYKRSTVIYGIMQLLSEIYKRLRSNRKTIVQFM